MFGNGTKSVNIEDITLDNFTKIKEKMLCAGININLQMFPSDIIDDTGVAPQAQLNLDEINMADDNIQLQEYEFKVMNATTTYVISFNLVHRQL